MCSDYAKKWRFRFGIKKTHCMVVCGQTLTSEPVWYLNGAVINNTDCLEILGVHFNANGDASTHVGVRSDKCRRSFYSLRDVGMAYPGCASEVKTYLWNTMCQPVLLYGLESIHVSDKYSRQLETCQANLVKQCMGFSSRSRSTSLLHAINIRKVNECIKYGSASLLHRIFCIDSPVRDLCSHFLAQYLSCGELIRGTLVDRLVSFGLSPTRCAYNKVRKVYNCDSDSGVVDSIRGLLMHENFIKPYSEEHVLATLLTRSF